MENGINLLHALRAARALGVRVEHVRKSGELRLSHPLVLDRVRCNGRKKDASRHTVGYLRRGASVCADAAHRTENET